MNLQVVGKEGMRYPLHSLDGYVSGPNSLIAYLVPGGVLGGERAKEGTGGGKGAKGSGGGLRGSKKSSPE